MDKICYCESPDIETMVDILKQRHRNFIIITDKKKEYDLQNSKTVSIDIRESAYLPKKQIEIFTALSVGENIISHSPILTCFDGKCIKLCREKNYALVVDINIGEGRFKPEVMSFIDWNVHFLLSYEYLEPLVDNRFVRWKTDKTDYSNIYGIFGAFKNYCDLDSLFYFNDKILKMAFPHRAMKAFSNIIENNAKYARKEYCIDDNILQATSFELSGLSLSKIMTYELLKRFKF